MQIKNFYTRTLASNMAQPRTQRFPLDIAVSPNFRSNQLAWELTSTTEQQKSAVDDLIIPGFNHIIAKNHKAVYKLWWTIFMLVNLAICIYQISDRFQYYLSEPLRNDVSTVNVVNLTFPAFTICPYPGQHPKLQVRQRNLSEKLRKPYCKITIFDLLENSEDDVDINELWESSTVIDYSTIKFKFAGPSLWQPPRRVENVSTIYAMCYTYIYPVKYFPYSMHDWYVEVEIGVGLDCPEQGYVTMHAEEDYPEFFMSHNMDTVYRGDSMKYALFMKKTYRKSTRRRPCGHKEDVAKCNRDCFFELVKKGITCRNPDTPVEDIPLCNNYTAAFEAMYYRLRVRRDFEPSISCSHCLIKCDEFAYAKDLVRVRSTSGNISLATIGYFYPSPKVDVIREEFAYVFISLICDVGGNLGLFMGLSLISAMEIMEFSFGAVLRFIKKK